MKYTVKELLENVNHGKTYHSRIEWEKEVMKKYPHAAIKSAHETNQAPYGSYHNTSHAMIRDENKGEVSVGHFSSSYNSGHIV